MMDKEKEGGNNRGPSPGSHPRGALLPIKGGALLRRETPDGEEPATDRAQSCNSASKLFAQVVVVVVLPHRVIKSYNI